MFEYLSDMWALAIAGDKQGVSFFIALYAFFVLGYSFIYQYRVARWSGTRGFLLNAGVEKWGATERSLSNQEYTVDALYEYRVGEEQYQGTRISPWLIIASHNARFILEKQLRHIKTHDDGTVTVFYNPVKPQKSFLVKPGKVGMLVTLALALGPMLLYWLSYYR